LLLSDPWVIAQVFADLSKIIPDTEHHPSRHSTLILRMLLSRLTEIRLPIRLNQLLGVVLLQQVHKLFLRALGFHLELSQVISQNHHLHGVA